MSSGGLCGVRLSVTLRPFSEPSMREKEFFFDTCIDAGISLKSHDGKYRDTQHRDAVFPKVDCGESLLVVYRHTFYGFLLRIVNKLKGSDFVFFRDSDFKS